MHTLSAIAIAIVAYVHIVISVMEIFFWENPLVHERLGFSAEVAYQVAPIVQNAGLYNSFIAAGLLWSVFTKEHTLPLRTFFLTCVVIAGIFGAVTLRPTTLVLQTAPALLALILVWTAARKPSLKPE